MREMRTDRRSIILLFCLHPMQIHRLTLFPNVYVACFPAQIHVHILYASYVIVRQYEDETAVPVAIVGITKSQRILLRHRHLNCRQAPYLYVKYCGDSPLSFLRRIGKQKFNHAWRSQCVKYIKYLWNYMPFSSYKKNLSPNSCTCTILSSLPFRLSLYLLLALTRSLSSYAGTF